MPQISVRGCDQTWHVPSLVLQKEVEYFELLQEEELCLEPVCKQADVARVYSLFFDWSLGKTFKTHEPTTVEIIGSTLIVPEEGKSVLTLEEALQLLALANYYNASKLISMCNAVCDRIASSVIGCLDILTLVSKVPDLKTTFLPDDFQKDLVDKIDLFQRFNHPGYTRVCQKATQSRLHLPLWCQAWASEGKNDQAVDGECWVSVAEMMCQGYLLYTWCHVEDKFGTKWVDLPFQEQMFWRLKEHSFEMFCLGCWRDKLCPIVIEGISGRKFHPVRHASSDQARKILTAAFKLPWSLPKSFLINRDFTQEQRIKFLVGNQWI